MKRFFQAAGKVRPFSRNDVRPHLLDRIPQIRVDARERLLAGVDLQLPLGALVHVEERAIRCDDEDGIGKAVDRCL